MKKLADQPEKPARTTLSALMGLVRTGGRVPMLTCYDATTASLLAEAGFKTLMAGDSAAQGILGYDSTLPITLEFMLTITAAVRRGAPNVWLVGDMPFLSYQCGLGEAVRNAGRFLAEGGADAVKIEMDRRHLTTVEAMAAAGIPVMAHLGLLPQHLRMTGQMRAKGRDEAALQDLVGLAKDAVQAGATSILLEALSREAGAAVTQAVGEEALVIGCGAGAGVHGQVLVLHDVLGLNRGHLPRFAKVFGEVGTAITQAAGNYRKAVERGTYPDTEHSYGMKK